MTDRRDKRWQTRPDDVTRQRPSAGARRSRATQRRATPRPLRREDPGIVVSRNPRDDERAAHASYHVSNSRPTRGETHSQSSAALALQRLREIAGRLAHGFMSAVTFVREHASRQVLLIGAGVIVLLCVAFIVVPMLFGQSSGGASGAGAVAAPTIERPETDQAYKLYGEGRTTGTGNGRVTFCAVGDNLMNDNLLALADEWGGSEGDGVYDFAPFYTDIAPIISSYDLSFVNQETTMGGTENFDYMGYPSYNTPDSLAQTLVDVGFKVMATNSNHTYDTWVPSIEHQQELLADFPDLLTIGSYASEEDRNTPRVAECNNIRISFLSYSYGQNGYELSDLPNDYYAVPYSDEALAADVERAREVSDFVIVYLHMGDEYTHEPTDEQRRIAQYAADLGVGMMIGSHAHIIQPLEWIERSEGTPLSGEDGPNDGRMLVAYGLGDFVSGYENNPETIMSGMLSCTFVRGDGGASDISVEDVVWHPVIEHREGNEDKVMLVSDYTPELANQNELLAGLDDPYAWIESTTKEVIGPDFSIAM